MGSQKVEFLPAEYYKRFLSKTANDLKTPLIAKLLPLENAPGMISFVAGKPNEDMFPFTSLSFTAISPSDPSQEITATLTSSALKQVLQYTPADGIPNVKEWIAGLQEDTHGRKYDEGWTIAMGVGSQDMSYKAIMALLDPGDSILIENPGYSGLIPVFASLHCEMVEVETDLKGLIPASLRKILENWQEGKPKPKLLHTVPYGNNPTGMTTTTERRREILALAREHDFLIMEDDPYYWLYYSDEKRPPSYFQLELELPEVGRVLRFDSFSKIISAGVRFGWVSGPKVIIDAINAQTASSNLHASGVTQAMVVDLVKRWGYDGFKTFTRNVSDVYRRKRDIFDGALQEYLGDVAEWNKPESGLYFWVKLLPNANGNGECDTEELILRKACQDGVLALPGAASLPNGGKSAHVRFTFSLLSEEKVHEGLRRLRAVIMKERATA